MAVSVNLPGSIKVLNPFPLDYWRGPWASVAAAKAGVPLGARFDGLTVKITGDGEYWWLAADLTDTGLVPVAFNASTQAQNLVFAGPASGAAAVPTFRSLVLNDIPSLSSLYLPIAGGTLTGNLILNADPVTGLGAATKNYVDGIASGLSWKNSVDVATTGNITLSGEQTIDGELTSTSDVLVWQQADPTENGIYVSAAGAWSRRTDSNTGAEIVGTAVAVLSGTLYNNTRFVYTGAASITIGVDDINYTIFDSGGTYTAGTGLDLTGNVFSIDTNGVTNALFRQSAAVSVVGRSANSTGDVADIAAASNYQIFRRSGDALAFGSIDLSQSAAVGSSILGIANGGTALSALGSANQLLRVNSGATALEYYTSVFSNGLTAITGGARLGGTLTQTTLINPSTYDFEVATVTGLTGFLSNAEKFRANQVIDALPPTLLASTSFTLTYDLDFSTDFEITWTGTNVPAGGVTIYLFALEYDGPEYIVSDYGTVNIPDNTPVVVPFDSGPSNNWLTGYAQRIIVVPNDTSITPYILTTNELDPGVNVDAGPIAVTQGTVLNSQQKDDIANGGAYSTGPIPGLKIPLLGASYYYELISTGHSFEGPTSIAGDTSIIGDINLTGDVYANASSFVVKNTADTFTLISASEGFGAGFTLGSFGGGGGLTAYIVGQTTGTLTGTVTLQAGTTGDSATLNIGSKGDITIDAQYDSLFFVAGNVILKASGGGYTEVQSPFKVTSVGSSEGTIPVLDASGNFSGIGIGTDTYVLTMVAGLPAWAAPTGGGTGDVVGPASATDNAIARFDLTTGKIIQNSALSINDSGELVSAGNFITRATGFNAMYADGGLTLADSTATYGIILSVGSAASDPVIAGGIGITKLFSIYAAQGSGGSTTGGGLLLRGGHGHTTGTTDAGAVTISSGAPNSGGNEASVNIQGRVTGKLGFFAATPVVKQSAVTTAQGIADALTAYGLIPSSTISGGGGITNGAAANELMKSDGTNAVASGFFSTTAGDLILGSASIAGNRTISIDSSGANQSLTLKPKGTGSLILQLQADATLAVIETTTADSGFYFSISGGGTTNALISRKTSDYFAISTENQGATSVNSGNLAFYTGSSGTSTNTNSGSIFLSVGAKNGSGKRGNISLHEGNTALNFQSMELGLFIADALTNPTGNPTGGGFLYSDAGDSSKLKWRVPGGTTYDLTGGGGSGDMLLGTSQTVTALKTFNTGTFALRNPANTFSYNFLGSAIVANRDITLPLLTAADVFAMVDFTQTFTNKTINLTSNTLVTTKAQLISSVSDDDPLFAGDLGAGLAIQSGLLISKNIVYAPTITANAYTLQASDNKKTLHIDNGATAVTVNLPDGMVDDFSCDIINKGTGILTLVAATTLESTADTIEVQNTGATVYHDSADVWTAVGSLGAPIVIEKTISFVINSSSAITTGGKTFTMVVAPFTGTIKRWKLSADITSNITMDLWKAAGAVPTNANTITASAKPSLSSAQLNASSTLTSWDVDVTEGDVFIAEVEANDNALYINLEVIVEVV
jgi:hypothetical protein